MARSIYALSKYGKVLYERVDGTWQEFEHQPPFKPAKGTLANGPSDAGVLLTGTADGDLLVLGTDYSYEYAEVATKADQAGMGASFYGTRGSWDRNWSLAMSGDQLGDLLFVGEPNYNNRIGRVRVYQRTDLNTWTWLHDIDNPHAPDADYFGHCLSYSNGTLAVGAPLYQETGESGAVFMFIDDGATFQQKICIPYRDTWARCGRAAIVVDDRVVIQEYTTISGWGYDQAGDPVIHTYTRSAGVWSLEQTLLMPGIPWPSPPYPWQWRYVSSQAAIAFDGARILKTGTYGAPINSWECHLYVYELVGGEWQIAQDINYGTDIDAGAVAVNGTALSLQVGGAASTTVVHIYEYAEGSFSFVTSVTVDPDHHESYAALQMPTSTRIVLGQTSREVGGDAVGGIRVIDKVSGTWTLTYTLTAHQGALLYFGNAVAAYGDYIIGASLQGEGYLYYPVSSFVLSEPTADPEGFLHFSSSTETWTRYAYTPPAKQYVQRASMVSSSSIYAALLDTNWDHAWILHFDGESWTEWVDLVGYFHESWGARIFDIVALSDTDIWVTGAGVVLHYDGDTWTNHCSDIATLLGLINDPDYDLPYSFSIWCSPSGTVHLAILGYELDWDEVCSVVKWSGTDWAQVGDPVAVYDWYAEIDGTTDSDFRLFNYTSNDWGEIRHCDGSSLTLQYEVGYTVVSGSIWPQGRWLASLSPYAALAVQDRYAVLAASMQDKKLYLRSESQAWRYFDMPAELAEADLGSAIVKRVTKYADELASYSLLICFEDTIDGTPHRTSLARVDVDLRQWNVYDLETARGVFQCAVESNRYVFFAASTEDNDGRVWRFDPYTRALTLWSDATALVPGFRIRRMCYALYGGGSIGMWVVGEAAGVGHVLYVSGPVTSDLSATWVDHTEAMLTALGLTSCNPVDVWVPSSTVIYVTSGISDSARSFVAVRTSGVWSHFGTYPAFGTDMDLHCFSCSGYYSMYWVRGQDSITERDAVYYKTRTATTWNKIDITEVGVKGGPYDEHCRNLHALSSTVVYLCGWTQEGAGPVEPCIWHSTDGLSFVRETCPDSGRVNGLDSVWGYGLYPGSVRETVDGTNWAVADWPDNNVIDCLWSPAPPPAAAGRNWSYELAGDKTGEALYWLTQPSTASGGEDLLGGAEDIATFNAGDTCVDNFESYWNNTDFLWEFFDLHLMSGARETFEVLWGNDLSRADFDFDDLHEELVDDFHTSWSVDNAETLDGQDGLLELFGLDWNNSAEYAPLTTESAQFYTMLPGPDPIPGLTPYELFDYWTSLLVW